MRHVKTLLISVLLIICLMPITSFSDGNVDDTIICSWNMEPADNMLHDSSSNGINLNAESIVKEDNGVAGACSVFAGNQTAYCADNEKLDGFEQFSVSLWIKPNQSHNGADMLIDKDESYRIAYIEDESAIQFIVATDNNGWYEKMLIVEYIPEYGKWTHIVGVYNGQDLKLYIDGKDSGTTLSGLSGAVYNSDSDFYISRLQNSNSTYERNIDEVRMYNKALSDSEIESLYNEGNTTIVEPATPGLVGKWNKISDNTVNDSVGENNGIIGDSGSVTAVEGFDGGAALNFDGGSVSVKDSPSLNNMEKLTITSWVNLERLPEKDGFVLVGKDIENASYRLRVHNNGTLSFAVATDNNDWYSNGTVISTKEAIGPDLWYYIAAIYDGRNISIYVNGELWAKSQTEIGGSIKYTDSDLYFGSAACGEPLFASMQDICIYNIALEQENLKDSYNTAVTNSYLLDIDFKDGKPVDSSKNKFDITVQGEPEYKEENGEYYISLDGVKDSLAVGAAPICMNNLSTMSIRARIRLNELDTSKKYALVCRDEIGKSTSFHSVIEKGLLVFAVKSDDVWYSGNFDKIEGKAPSAGKWTDIELRYNKGKLSYYLNGILEDSTFTGNGGKIDSSELPLSIGTFHGKWPEGEDVIFLNADLSRITISNRFIAYSKAVGDNMGGEEILNSLKKEMSINSIDKVYIPSANSFTYNLTFNVNGNRVTDDVLLSLAENCEGVSLEGSKLVISNSASVGDLKLQLTYKYDTSIKEVVSVPMVKLNMPEANSVKIEGTGRVNKLLKSTYSYNNSEFPEKTIEYYWARSTSANGNYSIIGNAKTSTYTPAAQDLDCYIKAGVKVVTFLEDYVEEEIPANIVWSDAVKISAEQIKDGGVSWGGGSGGSGGSKVNGSVKPPSTPVITPPENNQNQGGKNETDSTENSFKDITGHWAYDAIVKLQADGIIQGISENEFAPDISITRAEAAALIVRALKLTEIGDSVFTDIDEEWYAADVKKISAAQLMNGSDGYFRPNDKITREEMAKLIDNVMMSNGKNTFNEYSIDDFNDRAQISSWAENAVSHVCGEQIMVGIDEETFAPKEFVTRAQAAMVLSRLMK